MGTAAPTEAEAAISALGTGSTTQALARSAAWTPGDPTSSTAGHVPLHPPPQALLACDKPALYSIKPLSRFKSLFSMPRMMWLDWKETLLLQAEGPGGTLSQCDDIHARNRVTLRHLYITFFIKIPCLNSHITQANKQLLEKKGTVCGLKPQCNLNDFKLIMCPMLSWVAMLSWNTVSGQP